MANENYELLRIKVKDFGVIKEGEIKLKPLTIFFGKNNTGKTYVGYLIWGIFDTHICPHFLKFKIININRDIISKLKSIITNYTTEKIQFGDVKLHLKRPYIKRIFNYENIDFKELEISTNEKLEYEVIARFFKNSVNEELADEILSNFLNEEKMKNKKINKLCIGIFENFPWAAFFRSVEKDIAVGIEDKIIKKDKGLERIIKDVILSVYEIILKTTIKDVIYLPASKSGLILSSGLFIDKLFDSSAIFKIYGESKASEEERLSFPEPLKDFMRIYLKPDLYNPDINQEYQDIALLFENHIIKGKLVYDKDMNKLMYITKEGITIPFHCASSSVVETIPLLKLLKYSKLIKKGTLLIIEEPEAHLHPDAQRIFARAIVKLINKGVYVLLITHSPYILQQINNCIKLHYLEKTGKNEKLKTFLKEHKYGEDEILNPEKVAPYLFVDEGEGVKIKELEIVEGEGISYEAFYHTLLELHNETEELRDLIEGEDENFEE
jgi:predicted ATPase